MPLHLFTPTYTRITPAGYMALQGIFQYFQVDSQGRITLTPSGSLRSRRLRVSVGSSCYACCRSDSGEAVEPIRNLLYSPIQLRSFYSPRDVVARVQYLYRSSTRSPRNEASLGFRVQSGSAACRYRDPIRPRQQVSPCGLVVTPLRATEVPVKFAPGNPH